MNALAMIVVLSVSMCSITELTAPAEVEAQDSRFVWADVGLGLGSVGGAAGYLGGTLQRERFLTSFRARFADEQSYGEWFDPGPFGQWEEWREVGLLLGVGWSTEQEFASVAAGIAYTWADRTTTSLIGVTITEDIYSGIGFPLEANLFPLRGRVTGVGVCVFTNINPERTTYGATVSVHIGRLRP